MMSMVSAKDLISTESSIETTRLELHDLDLDNVPIARPLTESELVTIIVPAYIVTDTNTIEGSSILNITMPSDELFYSQAGFPNSTILKQMSENEPVAVLRIPDYMFRALVPDPASISIPSQYFKVFPSLQEFNSLRIEENRQINEEIKKIELEENATLQKFIDNLPPVEMITMDSGQWISRKKYTAPTNWQIDYEIGKMTLSSYTRTGFGHFIFEEREIGLNRIGANGYSIDAMEVVAYYRPYSSDGSNRIEVYPVFYNFDLNESPIVGEKRVIQPWTLPHDFGMHFIIGKGQDTGWYWISIEDFNPESGLSRWYDGSYFDTTPSQYIKTMTVSSEVGLTGQTTSFDARTTPIKEEWIRNQNMWYKPFGYYSGPISEQFHPPGKPMRYVSTVGDLTSPDGNIYTHAYCIG